MVQPIYRNRGMTFALLLLFVLLLFWRGASCATLSSSEWPKTDFTKRVVDESEILSGGPPRDGIPSIDNPHFVSQAMAAIWLHPQEPVIAVTVGSETKAYPLQILIWHEIVNDTIDGIPVTVTFCPLCNAAIAFDRRFDGEILDFGTSGRLRKSDLIMYDRQSESWWQQFTGRALIGRYAGQHLTKLPADVVAFSDFQAAFPESLVLSRNTGHIRQYGRNPYHGYDNINQSPFLFDGQPDPRLPPMERVLAVTVSKTTRLYPLTVFDQTPLINDTLSGMPLALFSREGMLSALDQGTITDSRKIPAAVAYDRRVDQQTLTFKIVNSTIQDEQTHSTWNLFGQALAGPLSGTRLASISEGVHFAFAWLAFSPDAEIYQTP